MSYTDIYTEVKDEIVNYASDSYNKIITNEEGIYPTTMHIVHSTINIVGFMLNKSMDVVKVTLNISKNDESTSETTEPTDENIEFSNASSE